MSSDAARALAALALIGAGGAALAADDEAILRCRRVAEAAARLACYDGIALGAGPSTVKPATAAASAAAATPVAPAAPAPHATAAERDFGSPAKPEELEYIDSALAEEPDGWRANTRFRLANGQVWQIADDSSGFLRAGTRKVRVRRGAMGAFYIEFEGTNRSPRVTRVL